MKRSDRLFHVSWLHRQILNERYVVKQPTRQRRERRMPIQSLDGIEVEIVYAEPSPEAERLLDMVVERIWESAKAQYTPRIKKVERPISIFSPAICK